MNRSDQWIILIMLLLIAIHFAAAITGLITDRFLFLAALVNLIAGLSIIIYWIQKQLRITQHIFELREMLVLCLEVIMVSCAVYYFADGRLLHYIKAIQYTFFTIHLLLLLAGLFFMLTFKMNRLI